MLRDYSKNKHCPICRKRITNRATYCKKHLYIKRGQKKGRKKNKEKSYSLKKKCLDCGKLITNNATRCDSCAGKAKRRIFVKYTYSKNKKCKDCGKPISNKAIRCRSCSKKGIPRYDMRGKNNPKWNGGWIPYYGPNWELQRKKVLKRDNYKCVICGKNDGQLNIHHQIPFSKCKNYKEANSLKNLITLCQKCHLIMEKQDLNQFSKFLSNSH